jgi:hypothetical protein
MASLYPSDDEYDKFWDTSSHEFPNTNVPTLTQHFPATVSSSETTFPPQYATQPTVNHQRGTYEPSTASEQTLLEAVQVQTAQLSILMNQLPAHLRTPVTRPFTPPTSTIPSYTTSGQPPIYTHSGPPDLLNDETLYSPSQ